MQATLESLVPLIIVFGFVVVVISLGLAHARAKIRYRAEVQKELIAKYSSTQELTDFLKTDAGRLFVRGATDDPAPPPRPVHEQIGITIGWGVLLLCVGVALLLVRGPMLPGGEYVGAVLTAVGVGFEINAGLRVLLSKKWPS